LAILGAIVIAMPGFAASTTGGANASLGNLLAASAAVTAAIYYSIGRYLRASLGLWAYVGLTYFACFVALLVFALIAQTPLAPQPARELGIFAALAIGPMLLGHTGMNWALKYLPAYVVNLTALGEPVGATILAALLPGIRQIPPLMTLVGGAIVLTGVVVAARDSRSASA